MSKLEPDFNKTQEAQEKTEALKNYTMADFDKLGYSEVFILYTKYGTAIFNFKEDIVVEGKVIGQSQKFIPELLAKFFAMKYYIKFCPASYYKNPAEMYRYDEKRGIYLGNTETPLTSEIMKMYKEEFTKIPTEKVFSSIRAITQTKRPEVDEHPFYIPMDRDTIHIVNTEGVYYVEVIRHSPERFILIGIPNSYEFYNENGLPDPKREAKAKEIFHKYLNAVLPDVKDQIMLQEFTGVSLFRLQLYNKALVALGKTRTGKTTLINILRNALGKSSCSSITFYEMAKNRFHTAELDGKLLNICDDLSSVDISNVSQFKVITGGTDQLGVEKKFKDPYTIVPITKHLFTCNLLPAVGGADSAFYGRFFIMKFKQRFTTEEKYIDKRLNTPDINTYILRWAMEGLLRVLNNDDFTYQQTPKEIFDIWNENNANPIVAFMNSENIINDPYGLYLVEELEQDIIEFARNRTTDELLSDNKPPNIQEIGRYISSQRGITKERHNYQGLCKTFYRGIRPNRITDYQDFELSPETQEEIEAKKQRETEEFLGRFVVSKGIQVTPEELTEFARQIDAIEEQADNEEAFKRMDIETEEYTERQAWELAEVTQQEKLVKDYEDWLNTPDEPKEPVEESEGDRLEREYKEWQKQQEEPEEPPQTPVPT